MEAIAASSSEVVTVVDNARASKKHNTYLGDSELPSSVNAVVSNDDLLIEILLRLPVRSLFLFKSVSKRWLSLIASPDFVLRHRSMDRNLHPPCGLFLQKPNDFVSFDGRIPSKRSPAFNFSSDAGRNARNADILQSCNGLFLCCMSHCHGDKYYVCNPANNQYKMLPQQHSYPNDKLINFTPYGIRMVFDPTKSPHYKVIYAGVVHDDGLNFSIQLQTYSSESISACRIRKGNWSVCSEHFRVLTFRGFEHGVYWNGAIHWLNALYEQPKHFKLDFLNEHPILTPIQLPVTSNGNVGHDCKLLESSGCLLLSCREDNHSLQLNIYEMRNGCSEWSVKYHVNLNDVMMPFPRTWSIRSSVCCVFLGEREEDSFMVIELDGKVLQYKTVLKTVRTLFDSGSASPRESCFPFIASFARCDPTF